MGHAYRDPAPRPRAPDDVLVVPPPLPTTATTPAFTPRVLDGSRVPLDGAWMVLLLALLVVPLLLVADSGFARAILGLLVPTIGISLVVLVTERTYRLTHGPDELVAQAYQAGVFPRQPVRYPRSAITRVDRPTHSSKIDFFVRTSEGEVLVASVDPPAPSCHADARVTEFVDALRPRFPLHPVGEPLVRWKAKHARKHGKRKRR